MGRREKREFPVEFELWIWEPTWWLLVVVWDVLESLWLSPAQLSNQTLLRCWERWLSIFMDNSTMDPLLISLLRQKKKKIFLMI